MPPAQNNSTITQSVSDVDVQFYDSLFLMRLIQEVQPDDKFTSSFRPQRPEASSWHQFLDGLCALCHFGTGGDTICAIGAEQSNGPLRFWLATNDKGPQKQKRHLERLLKIILKSCETGEDCSEALFSESLVFCDERVRNYSRQLRQYLKSVETDLEASQRAQRKFLLPGLADDHQRLNFPKIVRS